MRWSSQLRKCLFIKRRFPRRCHSPRLSSLLNCNYTLTSRVVHASLFLSIKIAIRKTSCSPKAQYERGKSRPIHVHFGNNCVPYEKHLKISYHFDFPGTAFVRKLKPCCHGPIQRLMESNQRFIQAIDTTGIPPCRRKHLRAQFTITRETRFAWVRDQLSRSFLSKVFRLQPTEPVFKRKSFFVLKSLWSRYMKSRAQLGKKRDCNRFGFIRSV